MTALPGSVIADQALAVADEDLDAELVLEGADLLGDAGLGGVQGLGGLGNVEAAARDFGEIAQLLELHDSYMPIFHNILTHSLCENKARPATHLAGTPCTSTTRSISGWWTSAWRSSATRRGASSPASCPRTNSARCGCSNGLYIQRHAPMLRIAIPYGLLRRGSCASSRDIARSYDRGYGHFTTRQNLQLNWPKLEDVPDILRRARHGADARHPDLGQLRPQHHHRPFRRRRARRDRRSASVWCEIIRQWSTFHPEFTYLPRKFKIAVNGALQDRAAICVHDIGLHAVQERARRSRLRGARRRRPRAARR